MFEKGQPKIAGRKKGTPNKDTANYQKIQQKIYDAVNVLDVVHILQRLADKDPRSLVTLLTKFVSNKVELSGTDENGNSQPLVIQIRGYKDDTAGNKAD